MSSFRRRQSLAERIPADVRERAERAGTTDPDWYAGRLSPEDKTPSEDSGRADDARAALAGAVKRSKSANDASRSDTLVTHLLGKLMHVGARLHPRRHARL